MYTVIDTRKNTERMQEIAARAQQEFFPGLQAAPGFVGFNVVNDVSDNTTTAILVFDSKAQFDAFNEQVGKSWWRTLDAIGHTSTGAHQGETVLAITSQR